MAQKIRLSFFAYDNGKEVNHTSGSAFVNSMDEAEQKAKEFVMKHYPEASDLQIQYNQKFMNYGGWIIVGTSNSDPDMAFLLVINKL